MKLQWSHWLWARVHLNQKFKWKHFFKKFLFRTGQIFIFYVPLDFQPLRLKNDMTCFKIAEPKNIQVAGWEEGRITVRLISSLTRLDMTQEEICCYLNVVKQLNPI